MFTVVIPVIEHASHVRRAVMSALACDAVAEVLICHGASEDMTFATCKHLQAEFPGRVRNLRAIQKNNRSPHHFLNDLCRTASQPWIRILNPGDFFLPQSFESIQLLAATENAEFVSGSLLFHGSDGGESIVGMKRGVYDPEYPLPIVPTPTPIIRGRSFFRYLLNQNFIANTSNMAFTRALFESVGGFQDLHYAYDLSFALRCSARNEAVWTSTFLVSCRSPESVNVRHLPHIDGEYFRVYSHLLDDLPEVESDPAALQMLAANKRIAFLPPNPKLTNFRIDESTEAFQLTENIAQAAACNVLLALGCLNYSFVAVSRTINDPPSLGVTDKEVHLVRRDGDSLAGHGRIIRCPPSPSHSIQLCRLEDIVGGEETTAVGAGILVGREDVPLHFARQHSILASLRQRLAPAAGDKRPVIFVLPIVMAVGGVERNIVRVTKHLQDSYRFVVITSDRISQRHGSLHWQLYESGITVFDLAEIATESFHLELLATICAVLPPDLVWICNGSAWLVDHASHLRRLFANVPIIDQEVYDTEEGWIGHYHEKGIQSFDHFIAKNSRIALCFTETFGIPQQKVSLIYSAIDETASRALRSEASGSRTTRASLGIPPHYTKILVFVGRLTEQKQPLRFLDLARRAQQDNPDTFFVMIGDGELAGPCQQFIEGHKLSNVLPIPYHPYPPEVVALADGMIITSLYEGLPTAMLESLAVGVPVLATDVGDIRLILEQYKSGLVCTSEDKKEKPCISLESYREFLQRLAELKQNASAAAERISERFGTLSVSEQYAVAFASQIAFAEERRARQAGR